MVNLIDWVYWRQEIRCWRNVLRRILVWRHVCSLWVLLYALLWSLRLRFDFIFMSTISESVFMRPTGYTPHYILSYIFLCLWFKLVFCIFSLQLLSSWIIQTIVYSSLLFHQIIGKKWRKDVIHYYMTYYTSGYRGVTRSFRRRWYT